MFGLVFVGLFIYQKVNYKVDVKVIVVGQNNQILEAKKGYLDEEPVAPDIEGYTFNHWEYNGEEYTIDTKLSENAEIVGVYDKNIVYYNVTFKYENGSKDTVEIVEEGTKVKIVAGPFNGMFGTVESIEADKVILNVDLFGQATSVEVEMNQIEVAG